MCWRKFAVLVSHCSCLCARLSVRKQTERPECGDKYKNAISWRHTREVFSLLNLSVEISFGSHDLRGFFRAFALVSLDLTLCP